MPDANAAAVTPPASASRPRGPLGVLLDVFSSVRLGIVLFVLLFIYMSIGSAGILYPTHPNLFHPAAWVHAQIRQWRPFEMTEFEWFHWWPFDVMMALLTINIVVTTLRRIPFKPVNYGVWTIHAGVVITILGCVIYFATKVEGDSPVARRAVIAEVLGTGPNGEEIVLDRARFVAAPGQKLSVGTGDRRYELEVVAIDPDWEMLTEGAEGKRVYSVNVQVRPVGAGMGGGEGSSAPRGPFIRQLLAGFPEKTEDVLPSAHVAGTGPRFVRAVRELGTPIVDETLRLSLDLEPQQWLFLRSELEKCFALYVRRPGETEWHMRPMHGMPLYNDYVASRDQIFTSPGEPEVPIDPIDVAIPAASPNDPFPDVTFRATGYLRYAFERSRYLPGGPNAPLNPVAWVTIAGPEGAPSDARLEALNPEMNKADGGLLQFRHVADDAAFARLLKGPALVIRVPSLGIDVREPIAEASLGNPDAVFRPIGGSTGGNPSGYAYRVVAVQDDLRLSTGIASVAIVELKTPNGEFRRWVFDDSVLTRDVTEEILRNPNPAGPKLLDDSIEVGYEPGHGLSVVLLVSGPDPNQLRLLTALGDGDATVHAITPRQPFRLPAGITVTVGEYMPRAISETKPFIIPPSQRNRDAGAQFSTARVEIPGGTGLWLPFHHFVFDTERDVLRRHRFSPTIATLPDGRRVEMMFSRERRPLPAKVALEEFVLTTHIGGFTGETSTIRDYTSYVRFAEDDGWGDARPVSVNKPIANRGLSFFQAQWDPPDEARFEGDRASLGLNYTVLGVGNRNGVNTMLAGTIIACIGMIYAFYIKPVIKRRQREAVQATLRRRPDGRPEDDSDDTGDATLVAAETGATR